MCYEKDRWPSILCCYETGAIFLNIFSFFSSKFVGVFVCAGAQVSVDMCVCVCLCGVCHYVLLDYSLYFLDNFILILCVLVFA